MRAAMLSLVLVASTALAQKNPDLEKAQQLLAQRKYPDALKALDAAEKKGGLDRDSYLTLLESKGIALASTNKLDLAELAFRAELGLDPKRELSGKYAGAINKAIDAAKEWIKANGPIEVTALEPGVSNGRVKQVSLAVKNDPQKVAKAVKFYVKADGGSWKPSEAVLTNGAASLDADAETVEWWAELQDDKKNQVAFLGSALRPIKNVAPAPAPVAVAKPEPREEPKPVAEAKPEPKPEPAPAEAVATTSSTSGLRIVGYAVAGAGLVALGVGTVFGLMYNSERTAVRDDLAAGRSTQAELFARDQAAIRNGTIANALLIGGGVLAATGVVLWFVGGPSSSVAVVPFGPTGLAVTGSF